MLCTWWNIDGIIYFGFVPNGRAVDAELYSEQIERVYEILRLKYPALVNRKLVLYQHDDAPAHRARLTRDKIRTLDGIEILPHPPYSPDIAPSDYGLFRSMEHFLRGTRFDIVDEVEEACRRFFASKSKNWFRGKIRQLAIRWLKVIENNGNYFEE